MEAVVVDAGSKLLKAGFGVPDQPPSLIIPTQMKCIPEDGSLADAALVEESVDPVVRGFVNDWDAMEDLLHYVLYTGLGWEIGNEGQVLFTDPLSTPKAVREQLVQMMFETFNISGFYATEQAVLSLYAVGRISGCAVDVGHGKLDIAPVIEGAVHHIASRRFEIGGMDLTRLLTEELGKSNPHIKLNISDAEKIKEQYACCADDDVAYGKIQHSCQEELHTLPDGQLSVCLGGSRRGFLTNQDIAPVIEGAVHHIASRRFEIGGMDLTRLLTEELGKSNPHIKLNISDAEKIKEQYACCADDDVAYGKIQHSCQEELHTLPDGQVIKVGKERYMVGEALFQPSILGLETHGIVEQLVRCISIVSSENHRQLLENTVLCGGTASMTGFEERFQNEASLCSSAIHPSLVKPPEYMPENSTLYSAWVGGAILAKVVFPQNQHITKADYDENGPSMVHRKCV